MQRAHWRNRSDSRSTAPHLARPAAAIALILAAAAIVPSLLYQQAQIHRALEVHVHQMPSIHWELFALAQVAACARALLRPRRATVVRACGLGMRARVALGCARVLP